jgi:fatty acid desaturase
VSNVGAAIPARLNIALVGLFLFLSAFQLFLLPVLMLRESAWWGLALAPCVLATTTHWSLIHEAIHKLLAPAARTNDAYGRALSIAFGASFELLRFPHLLHHHMNGTVGDRPEYYVSARRSRILASLLFYPQLLLGIYAVEFAGTIGCLMPRPILRQIARRLPKAGPDDSRAESYLLQPGRLSQIRVDACSVIGVYAIAIWCYGSLWPLLVLSVLARGMIVSVADNSYHYGAPLGAGARSAYNFKFPAGAGILHFNLHRVHHLHPNLPWIGLPAAFEAERELYDIGYVSAMLRQFRGPISDREYAVAPSAPRT